jgi:GWxTD domain-containing protein
VTGPLTKSGYDMVPYVSNFFPENLDKLSFYAEIYNTKEFLGDGKCVINTFIENYVTTGKLPSFTRFSTQPTNKVNIILSEFNIADLPTGSYNLVVEVRDKENKVVAEKKAFFQRKNPKAKLDIPDLLSVNVTGTFAERITNADSLRDFIRSLRPISAENEKAYADVQVKNADVSTMQKYLYTFWFNRDQEKPEALWIAYHKQVIIANKLFSTAVTRGYATDRGRVFLQYGPPDERVMETSAPNTYPYEVWHYYKLKDQTNKKFIFYNRDLVTNNYELLHSDAKGEIYDSRWQMKLHARTIHSPDFDIEKPGEDNFGDKSNDNFLHPK